MAVGAYLDTVDEINTSHHLPMKTASALIRLRNLEEHFRAMDDSQFRMDCLCLIASGGDNAGDTIGWDETEEFAELAIRSIESLLCDEESQEIKSAFKAAGVKF